MLTALFEKPTFVQFYQRDLPRVCLWVGLVATLAYVAIFLLPLFSGASPDLSVFHPFRTDFLAGLCLILLSMALRRDSAAVPTLFTVLGVLVAAQYVRVSNAIEGISGPVPLSYLGNALVTMELLAILVLYIYSVKRLRDSNRQE